MCVCISVSVYVCVCISNDKVFICDEFLKRMSLCNLCRVIY